MLQSFSVLVSSLPPRGTLLDSSIIDEASDASFLAWNPDAALAGVSDRIIAGSLAFWHAGKILIWIRKRSFPPHLPDIQSSVTEIFRLCGSVGDKVEYLNWVNVTLVLADETAHHRCLLGFTKCRSERYRSKLAQVICHTMLLRDRGDTDISRGHVDKT